MRYYYDKRGRPTGYSAGPVGKEIHDLIGVAAILLVIGAIIVAVVIFAAVILAVVLLVILIAVAAPIVDKVGYRMRERKAGKLPRHNRELNINEAARYLGLKTDAVRLLVKHKRIPSRVPADLACYGDLAPPVFDRFELQQWVQMHGAWLADARGPTSKQAKFPADAPAVGSYAEPSELAQARHAYAVGDIELDEFERILGRTLGRSDTDHTS